VRDVTNRALIAYRAGEEAGTAALGTIDRLLDLVGPGNRAEHSPASGAQEASDAGHRRA
jgi:hypothetical protein